jgi:hypothetical protein
MIDFATILQQILLNANFRGFRLYYKFTKCSAPRKAYTRKKKSRESVIKTTNQNIYKHLTIYES